MSARENILGALRAALGDSRPDAKRIRTEADALLAHARKVRPALSAPTIIDAFAARVVSPKVAATLERVASMAELPAAVARYIQAKDLPAVAALQPHPALHELDWRGLTLREACAPDETLAVALAEWGIAETGSVVFHSGPQTAILANFLPLHHLVAVRTQSIVAYLEDYARAVSALGLRTPRNTNITTGASGTTDIEGNLVRGAHGPRYLHILLVGPHP